MSPTNLVHLPNQQTLTVSPSFGGLFFKANDLNTHASAFPSGWTIILHSEEDEDELDVPRRHHIHRFKKPTLRHDHLYISSISNPSSSEFRPATSPTRQIAMMLWASLYWYFHQAEPEPWLTTKSMLSTPEAGRPKGEWRIYINREGIFKGKQLLPKLERMGLVTTEDSSVGADPEDGVGRDSGVGFERCFVSRRAFWQLDARIYLFTMAPTASPYPILSPSNSRPSSPSRTPSEFRSATPPGPFSSTSHLPTFYPPPPLQYTFTGDVRHPVRTKPPRQGEVFYTRYVPSLEQCLTFRVASLSSRPVVNRAPHDPLRLADISKLALTEIHSDLTDVQLLHKWMNDPRVAASWGEEGDLAHQEAFLRRGLESRHSFPVIGCFDGKPFGYFEVYWVKEDKLARHTDPGDWDRGLHVLVGEQEFRGGHRVKVWLSALVHYCFLADMRTGAVFMEPRVDNEKVKQYCEEAGFHKEKEVTFPHKQSNLMKIKRDAWESPAL